MLVSLFILSHDPPFKTIIAQVQEFPPMPITADIYYFVHDKAGADNPPVVLIHGAGGSHLHWPSEVRRLPGYRVYALDLPGHGKSTGRGLQSVAAYADAVLQWLEAVDLHRAVLVGHSMGGAIVQHLAINAKDQVLGLGLVGTGARLRVHPDILQNTLSEKTYRTAVDTVVRWAFSPQTPPDLVELATQRMGETRPSVLHGDFVASDAFDLIDQVSEINQPAVVICGADDQLTPLRYSQFLADNIPNAQLEVIPAAGHMVMLEKPQEVAGILGAFIEKIRFL
jgi:pimeloyl-ACP methyl ester carboxylesterase